MLQSFEMKSNQHVSLVMGASICSTNKIQPSFANPSASEDIVTLLGRVLHHLHLAGSFRPHAQGVNMQDLGMQGLPWLSLVIRRQAGQASCTRSEYNAKDGASASPFGLEAKLGWQLDRQVAACAEVFLPMYVNGFRDLRRRFRGLT